MKIHIGAVDVCTQKVSETEAMIKNGIKNILLSNEVIGIEKLRRLVKLFNIAEIKLCVDSDEGIDQLAQAGEADIQADQKYICI